MGLENQLSDFSSESIIIIAVVFVGKSVNYLHSLLCTILHALGLFSIQFDADRPCFQDSLYVGSGLVCIVLICEQLNLNRVCSYPNQSEDGSNRFRSDCVVCLDRLREGDQVRKLTCRHVFHRDCFDGWLGQLKFTCPLCRAPLVAEERVENTRRRVAGDLLTWFPVH